MKKLNHNFPALAYYIAAIILLLMLSNCGKPKCDGHLLYECRDGSFVIDSSVCTSDNRGGIIGTDCSTKR